MFETLVPQPPDALLAVIKACRADTRPHKLDLGVGVYRDETGITPVMRAVKEAERLLWTGQTTKTYLGTEGDTRFLELVLPVALGPDFAAGGSWAGRVRGVQTPGGTGALRLAAELIKRAKPDARVWLGVPSWINHSQMLEALGLEIAEYSAFTLATQTVAFESTLDALNRAEAGDVALLHGCCHNPTGADFSPAQWAQIAALVAARGLFPLIDLAYQGLGDGLEADAIGARQVIEAAGEGLLAYSCDKNFGLYRERTGALFLIGKSADAAAVAASNAAQLARVNWSMPPDHGAAVVRMVLESAELTALWREELAGVSARINAVRRAVAEVEPRLGFIAHHRGLFSTLPLSEEQCAALSRDHAIYTAVAGRINLAGIQEGDAPALVRALDAVGLFDE